MISEPFQGKEQVKRNGELKKEICTMALDKALLGLLSGWVTLG